MVVYTIFTQLYLTVSVKETVQSLSITTTSQMSKNTITRLHTVQKVPQSFKIRATHHKYTLGERKSDTPRTVLVYWNITNTGGKSL